MNQYQTALKMALKRDMILTIGFIIAFVVVGGLIIHLIKEKIFPKWTLCILTVGVILFVLGSIQTIDIYQDMREESYVVYQGNYEQRHEGYDDSYYPTVLLDGEKIKLKSHVTLTSNTGRYYGYVVYGKRSKIVVYIGEDLPTDLQGINE